MTERELSNMHASHTHLREPAKSPAGSTSKDKFTLGKCEITVFKNPASRKTKIEFATCPDCTKCGKIHAKVSFHE